MTLAEASIKMPRKNLKSNKKKQPVTKAKKP